MFHQTLIPVAHTRKGIALTIERLIEMLDDVDGDPDFEVLFEDDEDTHDTEPSITNVGWYMNGGMEYDLEQDPCDAGEPTLGWTNAVDQDIAQLVRGDVCVDEGEIDILDFPYDDEELEGGTAEYALSITGGQGL